MCTRAPKAGEEIPRSRGRGTSLEMTGSEKCRVLLGLFFRRLRLHRNFLVRRNLIFRLRHALQPMIEPAHDMLETFDAVPGLTGTGKFMTFVRELDHHRGNLAEFERA